MFDEACLRETNFLIERNKTPYSENLRLQTIREQNIIGKILGLLRRGRIGGEDFITRLRRMPKT